MTVSALKQSSKDRNSAGTEFQNSKGVTSPEMSINAGKIIGNGDGKRMSDRRVLEKTKVCAEVETDQESGGSSEEFESPKSVVAKARRWSGKKGGLMGCVHSQILKIREEDSHLGEDIGEGLSNVAKDKLCSVHHHHHHHQSDAAAAMVLSKPILPSSPLGGKTVIKF